MIVEIKVVLIDGAIVGRGMSVGVRELLMTGKLLEGITVPSMDGAMVSEEESLNDVGMSLDSDELLMIGGLLEGITV